MISLPAATLQRGTLRSFSEMIGVKAKSGIDFLEIPIPLPDIYQDPLIIDQFNSLPYPRTFDRKIIAFFRLIAPQFGASMGCDTLQDRARLRHTSSRKRG
jgi:hypothetical protein